jgi:hypothetical protein
MLLIGCNPQVGIQDVVGTYISSSSIAWHSLRLNSDSTFEYIYSYDLGGKRKPINGKYYLIDNKVIINSSVIPEIVDVNEAVVFDDSITIKIVDKDSIPIRRYPFIKINDWTSHVNMTLSILNSGNWKVGMNNQTRSIKSIQFTIGNYPIEYHPNNPTSNNFVFRFNINGGEFFRETFFINEPFLYKDGRLYSLSPTGYDYNMEYPMTKQ